MHCSAWYPVLFLAIALAVSLAVVTRRGLRTWRTFRAFSTSAEQALSAVTTSAEQAETHAVAFTAGTERLEQARARLQESLAELAVLLGRPTRYARSDGVRGLVPRKGRA